MRFARPAVSLLFLLFTFPAQIGLAQTGLTQNGDANVSDQPNEAEDLHIFVLAGQSNMAGRGKVTEQDPPVRDQILMLTKDREWVPARDPLHFDKPGIAGVGLGRTFAEQYLKQNPNAKIGLVPCAVGGSPISTWEPGGYHSSTKTHPWDDALPRIRHALQSGQLKGILWHQGESDAKEPAATVYEEKLHELIQRFRNELQTPKVPFIAGQMGQFASRSWDDARHKVDAAHRRLPEKIPQTAFVSSKGLTHKGDHVHFDADSYRELGRRYFAAWQRLTMPERANVLLILADDVGREVLTCYGGESYQTPNLDRLAATGQRYDHCYSMPVCHPTRVCLLTGRYPCQLGNPGWGTFPKAAERQTLAAALQDAGYATAVAGKWQLGLLKNDPQQPHRMGFDHYSVFGWHEGPRYHNPMIYEDGEVRTDTDGRYGPDLYTDFLIDFMGRKHDRPFFAFYSMALCHDVTDDLKEPVPYGPDGRWLNYTEMVHDMDRQVGKLMQALDRLKLRDQTYVIFTTDNGTASASYLRYEDGKFVRPKVESRYQGRMVRGGKGKLNDWGTRVPLIVNRHGQVAEGVVSGLVDFSDFLPTLTDLTGSARPADVEISAHSAAKLIRSEGSGSREWIFTEGRRGQRCVRDTRYRLYADGRMFDAEADPDEREPLEANAFSQIRKRLQQALDSVDCN
ncbi:MAG: hypothetical protein Fues2KO_39750 [Fuerstiella sp.]